MTINCPQCGSARIHRSRRRLTLERLTILAGGSLRRCHECNARYLMFGSSLIRIADLRRVRERCLLASAMAAAALLIMAAIIWFSHSQASSTSETGRLVPASGPVSVLVRPSF
jgi:hypothetical protein